MLSVSFLLSKLISWPLKNKTQHPHQATDYKNYKPNFDNEPEDYRKLRRDQERVRNELLANSNRFQRISDRQDRTDWPPEAHRCQSRGKYLARYRGFDVCKCPEDFVLYQQLFSLVKPATVIELGTLSGGMAVWIADTLQLLNVLCHVYSHDLDLSNLSDTVKALKPENVTFIQGDSFALEKSLTPQFLSKLPHPWVVIEDAHANMRGVLEYFHAFTTEGDYLVVEDTNPNIALGVGMGCTQTDHYSTMGPKQLNCLKSFLQDYQEYYAVDSFICDLFGYNGSWHWHGFVRRMK